jgi:hypothetical protein
MPQQAVQVAGQVGTAATLPQLEQHCNQAVPVAVTVMLAVKVEAAIQAVAVVVQAVLGKTLRVQVARVAWE